MPPFAGVTPPPQGMNKPIEPHVVTLNVGGRIFQTTPQTLASAGGGSLLRSLHGGGGDCGGVAFIDRDPELFSVLLSLLRTGRLPSKATALDLRDLAAEARFYGLDLALLAAVSGAADFDPFALRRSAAVPLPGRDCPSAVAAAADGAVLVAHGSKITSLDWSLRRKTTLLTGFPAVDSLLPLPGGGAAAGATDFPGLQILDLAKAAPRKTLHWSAHPSSSSSTVQGIESSTDHLFGSFESCRRNASAVLAFDLAGGTLRPTAEIGRKEIYGADLDSAIPATILKWVPGRRLLMAAGSHSGPSGQRGIVRLWDVRSPLAAVWERIETVDCFADVTAVDDLSALFKIGVNSGEVYTADLRKLGAAEDPWRCLGDARRAAVCKKEGAGCKIGSHGGQVFCARAAEVEMWSEVVVNGWDRQEGAPAAERVMRKNLLGRAKDSAAGKIELMAFGGSRMVIARKAQQSVEIWESSSRG
ncbi:BTB/POZ domain with WD40/YVTN repeat-like protein [Wolffia australiana]